MKATFTILTLLVVLAIAPPAFAQEMSAQDFLDEAGSNLKARNYREAINSLNMAINEINNMLIEQIRETLPTEIDGYKARTDDDESSGTAAMGMFGGGLSVERNYYKNPDDYDHYFQISVVGNSPLLASVNMMLSNSMYMAGTGNKVIRIDSHKAILSDEGNGTYKLQLPLSNSLISVDGYGFNSSSSFMDVANQVNFTEIINALGE